MIIMSTSEITSRDETIRCALKWFILTQRAQTLEFVNLKCVIYAQHISLPLNTLIGYREYYKSSIPSSYIGFKGSQLDAFSP